MLLWRKHASDERWVPEYGEGDSEPDRNGVDDDAEAGEEEHVVDGGVAVSLRIKVESVQHVETQRKRQVGGHREPVGHGQSGVGHGQSSVRHGQSCVGHGQSGEDTVGRRDHIRSRQHDDVERVGDDAEDADDAGQVAMVTLVPVVQCQQLVGCSERESRRLSERHRVVEWHVAMTTVHHSVPSSTITLQYTVNCTRNYTVTQKRTIEYNGVAW